jgi:O-methyltransferase involved in polyketide biosynthesis
MIGQKQKRNRFLAVLCSLDILRLAGTVWCLSSSSPPRRQPAAPLTPVQSTSLLVAYWRDLETKSTSNNAPLIRDEPASVLLDAFLLPVDQTAYDQSPIRNIGWNVLAVRTRLLDDWLLYNGIFSMRQQQEETRDSREEPTQHLRRQIVVLGAGMCARPYRLVELSSEMVDEKTVVVYEVDFDAALLEKKRLALEDAGWHPVTRVVPVQADLTDAVSTAEALQKAGLDANIRTDWIAEGVLEYLNPHVHHKPLFAMAAQCVTVPGCRFGMQILEPKVGQDFCHMGVNLPWNELVNQNFVLQGALDSGWQIDCVFSEDNRDFETMYQRTTHCPGLVMAFLKLV